MSGSGNNIEICQLCHSRHNWTACRILVISPLFLHGIANRLILWIPKIKAYRVFNKCTLTVEESPHVVFAKNDARLARKVSCDDLIDSLENIYLNDDDEVDNSKESQDEEVEPPVNEEQPQEEETPMPRAWRTSKNHPLDKVIGDINRKEDKESAPAPARTPHPPQLLHHRRTSTSTGRSFGSTTAQRLRGSRRSLSTGKFSLPDSPPPASFMTPFHDEDGALISNVNGVDIYLNEENIQILTGLRRDGQDLGLYVGAEGARFNETALLEEVGIKNFVPTPQQRRPTNSSMSPVFRFIFYVLTRILKPRKFNHTTLSQEHTKTIHAMIRNANLNWCKFVMTHMFTATSDNRPLPYALLVMAILEEYNIKTDVGPKIKGTKHWEIDESSFHSGTDETLFRQPRPRRQPRATASNATASTNPSLAEQMAALTATLSRIHTNVSQTAQNVNILSRELHGYFDFVNYPYAQMVPYAPPPNVGGAPSGTNNIGGDEEVDDEEEEEEAKDDDEDDEEEDIDEDQLLNDLSPDF
ncbi:unnamed protein product [Cuscuta campestris]|uniref:Uncharacterized protein n=1 Tax=Cuscuta campestris TaxID=132261 RepID=A0A484M277_9ASTE|nr:unnamed protein product [Cuscuta campestris]